MLKSLSLLTLGNLLIQNFFVAGCFLLHRPHRNRSESASSSTSVNFFRQSERGDRDHDVISKSNNEIEGRMNTRFSTSSANPCISSITI